MWQKLLRRLDIWKRSQWWQTALSVALGIAAAPVLVVLLLILFVVAFFVLVESGKTSSFLSRHEKIVSVSAKYDTFTDSRDGKTYRTIKMPDGKTWMAENLDYQTGNSWYYKDSFFGVDFHYTKYGRLYDWKTAINVCPNGWHLPSFGEWDSLAQAVGGVKEPHRYGIDGFEWHGDAGTKLKAKRGWGEYNEGTDDYGFSALPGGAINGHWWTATDGTYDYNACVIEINYRGEFSQFQGTKNNNGKSVRCVADTP